MSIRLSSMHYRSVQYVHHSLLTSEMLCYRSSNTSTQSSALQYQVSRSLTLLQTWIGTMRLAVSRVQVDLQSTERQIQGRASQ
ncbi:hypothetical protein P692DRAFT_20839744 [Suillus brevipes Sb2]|nr:hypothetical protein P692DRAFT_20839744 [Suillus brevipes Sb2]